MADTTPTLREAAQQALEALVHMTGVLNAAGWATGHADAAVKALRAALAEQAAEQGVPSEHRPDPEWYARMIRETAGDDFVVGPAFKLPEQAEPVAPYAWLQRGEFGGCTTERLFLVSEFPDMDRRAWIDSVTILPLYLAAPPAPARQGPLTDEQITEACRGIFLSDYRSAREYDFAIARAIERAHGITAAPAAPARQPAPALTVGMLMEAGLMVGSTPDSVGTSNWAARMLRALRMLAANQRTAAALPQPEGGA